MGALSDRVAIVTGGGDGIGRALVRAFAAAGATVVVAEVDRERGNEAAAEAGGRSMFVPTDVSVKAEVESVVAQAADRYGRLDILVNNAWGGGELSRVEHKSDALITAAMHVGFDGPRWAMQAAFPHMRAQGWGRVINMVSLNGVNAHMGTLEYNCAKEALRALTRTAAREWAPYGIVVNAIAPGAKSAAFRRVMSTNPELEAAADASNPMGRIGDPDLDIAPVAVFLASEGARYVTGNTIFVDGGGHINGVVWQPELPD